ncbi:MAG: FtsX-like permease family protein [Pseudomonadota bacterium]
MEFGPIFRALLRNKGGAILIALQIAVTMAIMVNSIAIMQQRAASMARPSGLDEANTFTLTSINFASEADTRATYVSDLELIRNTPGVVNAIGTNSFPLRGGGWSMGLQTEPGEDMSGTPAAIYFGDEHMLETFDVELIDGSNFTPEQVVFNDPDSSGWEPYAIITEALANSLFPDEEGSVVGKTVYIDQNEPVEIVGIIDQLQAPWQGWSDAVEHVFLTPLVRADGFSRYVVRTEPGQRERLLADIEERLAAADKTRLIRSGETFDKTRANAYLGDSSMIKILAFVVTLLTVITGLGIVGLASFNVSRRTRQIGIRRALGASKAAIMQHFMVENFIISSIGVTIGAALAIGLNIAMVEMFNLTPMNWWIIPIAMLTLWVVGQLAVSGPARKATLITPSIATRSG